MTHLFASRAYAEGLAGPDAVLAVPEWGSHVIRRPITAELADATGTYPMAVFGRGADLPGGLERLKASGLVSLVLVPDPLLSNAGDLRRTFQLCRPFKTHFLIDPAIAGFSPSKHHRDRIRRGRRRCRVEISPLADLLPVWEELYAGLTARHAIQGPAAFSPAYAQVLANDPTIVAFAAYVGDVCAGMTLWFAADGVVYNHLTAANALGYANGANFALYDAAIAHFAGQGVVNLGGGAGHTDADDGLVAFKRGFANSQATAHLCGSILDPARYVELSGASSPETFFPAYRGRPALAA
jgi:hypothetical protein